MSESFWFKDPTRLPCPRCGEEVDAGATLSSIRRMLKSQLVCPKCQMPLRKTGGSYGSPIPAAIGVFVAQYFDLGDVLSWFLQMTGFIISFYLVGKEIQAIRLVPREKRQ